MTRRFVRRSRSAASVLLVALPLALGVGITPAAAAPPAAGGFAEAYGLLIDTTLLEGNVPVKIGPLAPVASSCPPNSAAKMAEVIGPVGDPAVAKADVLLTGAATDCAVPIAKASARTTNVDALGAAGAAAKIHFDAITATSESTCTAAPTGSTVFVNLTVGGTAVPLPASVPPNFDLLPAVFAPLGLRVILNEQHPAASGRGLVVNGVHIIAAGTGPVPVGGGVIRGDVVISHAVSGLVCPNGAGTTNGTLPAPDIRFAKTAAPLTAEAGDTVTYTSTVTNTSATPCEVLKLIDHISPAFDLVSTAGAFGTKLDSPAPTRTDGGVDAVLRPTDLVIAPGKSLTQTYTVTVKDDAKPGTYYNSLEIYCGLNGNFVSGPLAPVTITEPLPPRPKEKVTAKTQPELPRTGGAMPMMATGLLLMIAGGLGVRRAQAR